MSTFRSVALSAVFSIGLSGCVTTGSNASGDAVPGTPDWFGSPTKGCGAGSAKVRGDIGMAQTVAIDRARSALAKNLEVEVGGLLKSYQDTGEVDGKDFTEEKTTNTIRTLVDKTLNGSIPVHGTVVDKNYYSMVCLDPALYSDLFDKMSTLSQKQRQFLKARADAEHADLDRIIKEKRERDAAAK